MLVGKWNRLSPADLLMVIQRSMFIGFSGKDIRMMKIRGKRTIMCWNVRWIY
jgi:hypothetical protein